MLPLQPEESPSYLEPDEACYLPLPSLVESSQSMSMFVITGLQDTGSSNAHADSITLSSDDLKQQQGIYRCCASDDCHVCFKVKSEHVQV
jgi:hypothetical protein